MLCTADQLNDLITTLLQFRIRILRKAVGRAFQPLCHVTVLKNSLLMQNENAEVRVYNDNWYFDSGQRTIGYFDFSSLFQKYHELESELISAHKRFAGSVSAQETTSFLMSCARPFYCYIISIFRYSILPCIEKEPFLSVKRAEKFEINVGEYMAYSESIYKENQLRSRN